MRLMSAERDSSSRCACLSICSNRVSGNSTMTGLPFVFFGFVCVSIASLSYFPTRFDTLYPFISIKNTHLL